MYVPFRQCPGCTRVGHYRPYQCHADLALSSQYLCTASQNVWQRFLNSLFNISVTKRLKEESYEHGLIVYSCRSDYGYRSWPISILLSIFERQRRLELALMLLWGGRTISLPPPPPQVSVCPTVSLCSLPWRGYGVLFLAPYMIASVVWTERLLLVMNFFGLYGICMCLMVPVCD